MLEEQGSGLDGGDSADTCDGGGSNDTIVGTYAKGASAALMATWLPGQM
jgi:hypothetical protein